MDQLDQAKRIEMEQRQREIDAQIAKGAETETPDEEGGIRYCLSCAIEIDKKRLAARPESVRCVDCKTEKEKREAHYA